MANYAVDSLQDGCYPGTVVLINILGIQNQSDLDAVEGTIVPAKAALWEEKPLAESFDFAHYCAIHRFLFEDLYEWAGKPRTVDISKKGTQFCPAAQIESTAKAIFALIVRPKKKKLQMSKEFPCRLRQSALHFCHSRLLRANE